MDYLEGSVFAISAPTQGPDNGWYNVITLLVVYGHAVKMNTVQFSPLTNRVVGGTRQTIQHRFFSSVFLRPLWAVLAWAGMSTPWCCPCSISSADHCIAHPPRCPRSGELRTQKLKSHLVRTQNLNVPSWKPGVHQYIAIHATLTDIFLPSFLLPFRSIRMHFFQNLSRFFLCWLCLTHGSCVGRQNKIGHPAGGRFPCWVPAEYK